MNIEQLNAYIENKEPLDQKAIPEIMTLIEKNPYFQIAHMLLLKAMHQSQPEKYSGQLKISAGFISDKKKLYQYIHSSAIQQIKPTEKKEPEKIVPEKIEKIPEIKNIEKVKEVEPIIKEAVEPDIKKEIANKAILPEEKTQVQKIEGTTQKDVKNSVAEDIIKKPEIKKKVDLPENEIEKLANQNSEVKHKKIVSDFFHTPAKDKTEDKPELIEQEPIKTEKKEFPSKLEIKSILEEKKKSIISKNEPVIIEHKIPVIDEIKKVEKETPIIKETSPIEKEIIIKKKPIVVEKVIDLTENQNITELIQNKGPEIVEEKTTLKENFVSTNEVKLPETVITEKLDENKKGTEGADAMNNIFSKIRQIKKEMNIETGKKLETIDIKMTKQPSDEKKVIGKQIKESFIGFEESEIKTDDLIGDNPILITKKDETIPDKEHNQQIKTSGLTAKDLFRQHLRNKDNEPENQNIKTEEIKSPISKIVEKINQPETKSEEIIEKVAEPEDNKLIENQKHENVTPSSENQESAAEQLLRRIAEKKKKLHEEKEKEAYDMQNAKDELLKAEEIKKEETSKEVQLESDIEQSEPENKNIQVELDSEKSELPKEKKSQLLIDSFIEKVDSLERLGNKETSLIGDISEKSTEEKDEFMTENMADLFVQQKNYIKAIEIYNKLILKFPEKKTYFAIQIKKTESFIK